MLRSTRSVVATLSIAWCGLVLAQTDAVILRVTYAPACDTAITLGSLQQLAQHHATLKAHDGEEVTYAGALLWDVVGAACPSVVQEAKRQRIGMAVRIEAVDGYHALVALMEADTSFREHPVLLCWEKNGVPLDAHDGPLQVIVADDKRHARNVRMVSALRVVLP